MNEEQMEQIANETYHFLNNKGVGFICYFWSIDDELGGGCNSTDADMGDAMLAIEKLVKHFNIDTDTLYRELVRIKLEQQEN